MELVLLEKEALVVKARDFIDKERWEDFAKGFITEAFFKPSNLPLQPTTCLGCACELRRIVQ